MQLRTDRRVSRCPLRQKQHGIFRAHRIRIEHLAKQFARVAELRFELRQHVPRPPRSSTAPPPARSPLPGPRACSRTPAAFVPLPVPRSASPSPASPAWNAATTLRLRSATSTGIQSAVWIDNSTPAPPRSPRPPSAAAPAVPPPPRQPPPGSSETVAPPRLESLAMPVTASASSRRFCSTASRRPEP